MVVVEEWIGKQVAGLVQSCYLLLTLFFRLLQVDLVLSVKFVPNLFLSSLYVNDIMAGFLDHQRLLLLQ